MRRKIRDLRKKAGLTQQALSEQIGISVSQYSRIEGGSRSPSLNVAIKIKRALKYEYDDIFFNQKSPV